jgi:hypothetical protein
VTEIVDAFFENYKLRNPRSATFAEFALGHVTRHLGKLLKVDVTAAAIKDNQKARACKRRRRPSRSTRKCASCSVSFRSKATRSGRRCGARRR